LKPVRLSLQGMWELYRTLKDGIGTTQEYLIDEILSMLEKVSQEDFLRSLLILYPKIVFTEHNPVEMTTLFVVGLKHNGFFAFTDVIQGLRHGNPK
jgi:hypothetical protein